MEGRALPAWGECAGLDHRYLHLCVLRCWNSTAITKPTPPQQPLPFDMPDAVPSGMAITFIAYSDYPVSLLGLSSITQERRHVQKQIGRNVHSAHPNLS